MAIPINDIVLPDNSPDQLLLEKHISFICNYGSKGNEYEHAMTEYLRLSGIYWCSTALDLAGHLKFDRESTETEEIIAFTLSCYCDGLFRPALGHDPHLLHTLSAIQLLRTFNALDRLGEDNINKTVNAILQLQQPNGSFFGDNWGEVDTRFSFNAVATLYLLGRLDAVDVDKTVNFILGCHNSDGGFGTRPDSESHSGQVYVCVGTLALLNKLDLIDRDKLGWWLCSRQLASGGLQGRPEKLPDVCYSWWVLASLAIIDRLHWIDAKALTKYILACQDTEIGGFSDRPGDIPDPFHTVFGLGGLSLLGCPELRRINPILCMTHEALARNTAAAAENK